MYSSTTNPLPLPSAEGTPKGDCQFPINYPVLDISKIPLPSASTTPIHNNKDHGSDNINGSSETNIYNSSPLTRSSPLAYQSPSHFFQKKMSFPSAANQPSSIQNIPLPISLNTSIRKRCSDVKKEINNLLDIISYDIEYRDGIIHKYYEIINEMRYYIESNTTENLQNKITALEKEIVEKDELFQTRIKEFEEKIQKEIQLDKEKQIEQINSYESDIQRLTEDKSKLEQEILKYSGDINLVDNNISTDVNELNETVKKLVFINLLLESRFSISNTRKR